MTKGKLKTCIVKLYYHYFLEWSWNKLKLTVFLVSEVIPTCHPLLDYFTPRLRWAWLTFSTLSNLLCQRSSLLFIMSIQCWRVARIPAVVALNVMDSPLKSTPLAFAMDSTAAGLSKLSEAALLPARLSAIWFKVAGVGVLDSSSISSSASWSTAKLAFG